jgi:hypothetical protein
MEKKKKPIYPLSLIERKDLVENPSYEREKKIEEREEAQRNLTKTSR